MERVAGAQAEIKQGAIFTILFALSFSHLLNDMIQSLLPAIYPILKQSLNLSFTQIGLVTLTNQMIASLLQPAVGLYTDRHPKPYFLPMGMGFTLAGLLFLSVSSSFFLLLIAAALVGVGSSVFHPESSRIAHAASGGRHGFAQSLFQVGGNTGAALGPLLAAYFILPRGQGSIAWFALVALLGIVMLANVGHWYKRKAHKGRVISKTTLHQLSSKKVALSITILVALVFSKYIYLSSITSYYTFYLIHKFGVSVQDAQIHLFVFLGAVALGTFAGGPIGDKIGRKYVIWISILGVLPFTLILPYADLFWTGILSIVIGLVLASAFSAILVYGQELIPGRVGMIAGLFFGLAFGLGGIGAAVLGKLADMTSIDYVYHICSYLPAIGLLTGFLPDLHKRSRTNKHHASVTEL